MSNGERDNCSLWLQPFLAVSPILLAYATHCLEIGTALDTETHSSDDLLTLFERLSKR